MRMCLPLTIPNMVKPTKHISTSILQADDTCPGPTYNATLQHHEMRNTTGTYDWSEYTQGIILGSFYWGYVLSHVPGGIIAERFGGKHTLGVGIFTTALFTLLTPWAIDWGGATALIFLRVVMGLCEGVTQPAVSALLSQWIPAEERSKISSFVFMGATVGLLATSLGLSPIMEHLGWPGFYYIFGGLGVVWYVLWCVLCYSSPRDHPFISKEEAKMLNEKLSQHTHADPPPVPWRHLLTSAPFWALVIVTIGRDWNGYTMMADMPKFLINVLKFSESEVGLLFLSMNVSMLISCSLFSWMSDWLIEKNYMSITNVRKLMASISLTVHGVFGVVSVYVGCNKFQYFAVSFVSTFTSGAGFPGVKANVLDLSPNYAGTVMAVSHGLAGLCGFGGPYVVGILVPNQSLTEWILVFWIIFAVTVVTNVVFVLFGSGEVQEWNNPNFERSKKKSKMIEMQEVEKLLTVKKVQLAVAIDEGINPC
ncbi:hypothetical protein TSAR_003443 [Trichomalopsis sarcophagae]|uniref:Major facilitator superfamily (MFS) profile domain-containing protein n=1 Tax=Trichomalopsis sarcophagae TaxID=543379 RepID=A0A232F859_9HYME|nr:hypothetical protein TSAR_003443 [Trichomalopsis sarcophagae]